MIIYIVIHVICSIINCIVAAFSSDKLTLGDVIVCSFFGPAMTATFTILLIVYIATHDEIVLWRKKK